MQRVETILLLLMLGCAHQQAPSVTRRHDSDSQSSVRQPVIVQTSASGLVTFRSEVVTDSPLLGLTEAEAITVASPRDMRRNLDGTISLFTGEASQVDVRGSCLPVERWLRLKFVDGRVSEVWSFYRPWTAQSMQ